MVLIYWLSNYMKDKMDQNINKSVESVIGQKNKSINPITAVILAVMIALLISSVNLLLFVRSDMYEKVRLIQNPEQIIINDEAIDISSPLTVEELNDIKADIDKVFSTLKNEVDYPESDLSESIIGF